MFYYSLQNSIFSSIQDTLQSFIGLLPASTSSHNLLRNDPYQPGDDEIFDVNVSFNLRENINFKFTTLLIDSNSDLGRRQG